MFVHCFILLCTAISFVETVPYVIVPQPHNVGDESDSVVAKLIDSLKNLNITSFMTSLRLPPCIHDCAEELGNTMASLQFVGKLTSEKTKLFCAHFDSMKSCLSKPSCDSILVEIGMHASEFVCNGEGVSKGLVSCMQRETMDIQRICERTCKFGATLMEVVSLNTKKSDALNLVDASGRKIISVPDVHVICNTSTCYLSCIKTGYESRCPDGGTTFVDSILTSVLKKLWPNIPQTEIKINDAYTTVLTSVLPKQCHYLLVQDKEIFLNTTADLVSTITPSPETVTSTFSSVLNGTEKLDPINIRSDDIIKRVKEFENESSSGSSMSFFYTTIIFLLITGF